jgi:hypothetical protein
MLRDGSSLSIYGWNSMLSRYWLRTSKDIQTCISLNLGWNPKPKQQSVWTPVDHMGQLQEKKHQLMHKFAQHFIYLRSKMKRGQLSPHTPVTALHILN